MISLKSKLVKMNACSDAVKWVGRKSLKTAWARCERGDWMLWLAGRSDIDRKLLVLAACDCAETALKFVPKGEERPARAIQTARDWCEGNASLAEVMNAADAAADATDDAAYATYAADAAAYATYAAAYATYDAATNAADATDAAAYAAYDAAYAAYAAVYAADDATDDAADAADAANAAVYSAARAADATACAADAESLKESARLVRKRIPFAVIEAALQEQKDE